MWNDFRYNLNIKYVNFYIYLSECFDALLDFERYLLEKPVSTYKLKSTRRFIRFMRSLPTLQVDIIKSFLIWLAAFRDLGWYVWVFYTWVRFSLLGLYLALSFIGFLSFYFFITTLKQLAIWFLICGFFFWLLSGFNFFLKRYRFGKATSALYRFWKRTNMCFWLIEGFLFLIFFYYYLNSSAEPTYFYDFSALLRVNLFSLVGAFFSFIYILFIIILLYYTLLALTYLSTTQLLFWFFICSLFIFYLFFIETYQFYYLLNGFIELSPVFIPEQGDWAYELESPRLRLKQQYFSLCLIAKYWHFLFIFISWVFLLLKSLEQKRFFFTLVGVNIQNFFILYILNSLALVEWIKWVYRRFVDLSYGWFFISPNFMFLQEFAQECALCLSLSKLSWPFVVSSFLWINGLRKFNLKKYCYTINHKRLGLNYFYFTLVTGFSGAILATGIRLEMAYPGSPLFGGDSLKYLQVITAHALIMIFFVVVPIFFGGFANYLLPYHVGSKDVAYPRLNSLGFWMQPCGYLLIAKIGFIRTYFWMENDKVINYFKALKEPQLQIESNLGGWAEENKKFLHSFENTEESYFGDNFPPIKRELIKRNGSDDITWKQLLGRSNIESPETFWFLAQHAQTIKRRKRHIVKCANASQTAAGWTFITPFSSKVKFTGVGVQDMLILGVYYAGISTTISLTNLLVTRRTLSMSGLRNRRILLPFISISILLMLRALAVITPILGSAMLMLALDRHWQTSFFDFAYGGDPIFFHHLFWFFGHPEVYVLVIPAFGVVNSIIPSLNFRRIASKHHLIWAIYIMNYMGFIVWGHHMYLIGLDHRSRALYSTITIMISLPATIKVVNWTFTLVSGALRVDVILLATISFILFFLVAGFTGMWLSHVSLNISMHDTLYVVAHFHLMLSGAVIMGIFTGMYYYFTTFFQVKFSRTLAYFHITYYTGGQWMTFVPLFWVSFSGLPRRLHDFPAIYMGWQSMATAGHFITMLGVCAFYALLIEAHLERKVSLFLHTLIPRFNKRVVYYLYKLLHLATLRKLYALLPSKYAWSYLVQV